MRPDATRCDPMRPDATRCDPMRPDATSLHEKPRLVPHDTSCTIGEEVCKRIYEEIDGGAEGDGTPMEVDENEPDEAGHPMKCTTCKKVVRLRSEYLLQFPGKGFNETLAANWGGASCGLCQECSGMPAERFKTEAKKRWKKFTGATRRRSVRDVSFVNLKAEIMRENPGADSQLIRVQVLQMLRSLAVCFTAAFLNDPECRSAAGAAYQHYLDRITKAAVDSTYSAADAVWARFSTGGDASYLTLLTHNALCSFVCRSRTCRFYGDNSQWICERRAYHFRCPSCYALYRPSAWKPSWIEAARVLGMCDPVTRRWSFWPASWGNSFTESWLRDQSLAYVQGRMHGLGAAGSVVGVSMYRLSAVLEQIGTAGCFAKHPFNAAGAEAIGLTTALWNWESIKNGYWGRHLTEEEAALPVFTAWDLLIQVVGNACLSGRAVAAAGL